MNIFVGKIRLYLRFTFIRLTLLIADLLADVSLLDFMNGHKYHFGIYLYTYLL